MKIYGAGFETICKSNEGRMMGMIEMLPIYGCIDMNTGFNKYDGVSV